MTPVIFCKEGARAVDIVAVFPTIEEGRGLVACYAHLGQHASCDRGYYNATKPAKPTEYAALLAELQRIGYDDLRIYKRWLRHLRGANHGP